MKWLNVIQHHQRDIVYLITIAFIVLCFGWQRRATVQTVDVDRLTRDFAQEINASQASSTVAKALAKQFGQTLPQALTQYAHTHHVVLVSSRLVLAGGQDVTTRIEKTMTVRLPTTAASSMKKGAV